MANVSLIAYETLEGGARGFSVHRLVQAVMRARLGDGKQDAQQSALSLMRNALGANFHVHEHGDWPQVVHCFCHMLLQQLPMLRLTRAKGAAEPTAHISATRIGTSTFSGAVPMLPPNRNHVLGTRPGHPRGRARARPSRRPPQASTISPCSTTTGASYDEAEPLLRPRPRHR